MARAAGGLWRSCLVKVMPMSPDDDRPYANLVPIVEALVSAGNEASRGGFVNSQGGYYCSLAAPIDFELVRANFEFPKSIELSQEHDTILDKLSWVAIIGPGAVPKYRRP